MKLGMRKQKYSVKRCAMVSCVSSSQLSTISTASELSQEVSRYMSKQVHKTIPAFSESWW